MNRWAVRNLNEPTVTAIAIAIKEPLGGTVEKGGGMQSGKGTSQMKDKSVGGSQSERTGRDSDTPLPSKSGS